MTKILIKGPSGKIFNMPLDSEIFTISASNAKEVTGNWLVTSTVNALSGVYRNKRLESFGSSLVFNSPMTDVGEEYILISSITGFNIIKIQLSPVKCSIENYHAFVDSYISIFGPPNTGARSVSGKIETSGRQPNSEEFAYSFIEMSYDCLGLVSEIRPDLAWHPKSAGGLVGIDAQRTLEAWKSNPTWYKSVGRSENLSIRLKSQSIKPVRVQPRYSNESNLFLGAAISCINSLLKLIPRTPLGNLASHLLHAAKNRMEKMDLFAEVDERSGWKIIDDKNYPRRSLALAESLLQLKSIFQTPSNILPSIDGSMPYYLMPPELIFQSYAVAKILLSLGATNEEMRDSFSLLKQGTGFSFGDYLAWGDTESHQLDGWRDSSSMPSGYRPDLIILNRVTKETLLVDAKFRHSDQSGRISSQSSIKDIQSYMQEYELNKAVIISPLIDGDSAEETISGALYSIKGIALPTDDGLMATGKLKDLISYMWNPAK